MAAFFMTKLANYIKFVKKYKFYGYRKAFGVFYPAGRPPRCA